MFLEPRSTGSGGRRPPRQSRESRSTAGTRLPLDQLTDREREMVAWVATGMSNQEIADRLVVSPDTVRTHVPRAMGLRLCQ
jgi:DNA-binding CsgD family transcriptional regulator